MTADVESTLPLDEHDLGRLGYQVTTFRDGKGCVVWDEREAWVGAGLDGQSAIADAVAKMLPSRAAREAVARTLAPSTTVELPPQITDTVVPSIESPPTETEPPRESPSVRPPEVAALGKPPSVVETPRPVPPSTPFTELDAIEKRIDDAEDVLPRLAPEIQRLIMFAWIARARSLEHAGHAIVPRVAKIASRLSRLAKAYWPGTIGALRINATPERSLIGLSPSRELVAARPRSWKDAAELVEAHLAKLSASRDYDDGWRDARWAVAEDADVLLAEAATLINGSLAARVEELADGALTRLVDAARKLRLARLDASDGRAWGALIGKLRMFVGHEPTVAAPLAMVLDPAYVPKRGWDEELRGVPSDSDHGPTPEQTARLVREATVDELADVLAKAFDVLDTPALVEILRPRANEIAALPPDALPERRGRRRLAGLKAGLGVDGTVVQPSVMRANLSEQSEPDDEPPSILARASRLASIREKLGAGRALFVSNREDPDLRERVARTFTLDVEWCIAEPRQIDATCERIKRGAFDLVLSATGFQHHATDIALSRAAKSAGTLYVRVNRGRVAACERALARELGITV